MEILLKQRINIAGIRPYKNYSILSQKDGSEPMYEMIKVGPSVKKTKTRFFYIDKFDYLQVRKIRKNNTFLTTNDKHIKRHFMNPFSEINLHTIERVIKKDGDKIILKLYYKEGIRNVNSKYFRDGFLVYTVSFNLKNGDITMGETSKRPKHKSSRFRKNDFTTLKLFLCNKLFKSARFNQELSTNLEFKQTYNDDEFVLCFLTSIGLDHVERLRYLSCENSEKFLLNVCVDFLIKHKKIKAPNQYFDLMIHNYPGEVFLKKNDRKLVMSILDSYGIKSKITNKILHNNPNIDVQSVVRFCSFFGEDYPMYLKQMGDEVINKFFTTRTAYQGLPIKLRSTVFGKVHNLTITDKNNIVKVMKSDGVLHDPVGLFNDHLNMMDKLRPYYPNIKFGAKTIKEFNDEHTEFTSLINLMYKGWSNEYIYDNRMLRKVEDEIVMFENGVERIFKPFILKRDEDYTEEGVHMHHCVSTYSNVTTSMIISLRLKDTNERVTCEVRKKDGQFLQERYFCNAPPPEYFTSALSVLKSRVKQFSSQRLLEHIEHRKTRVKINGIEVKTREESLFGETLQFPIDF